MKFGSVTLFRINVQAGLIHCSAVLLCVLATGVPRLYGQSATLSGPSLGFVWSDGDATLRPLQGILGNATIGDPLDLGVPFTRVDALDGRHFLGSAVGNPALLYINMESGQSPRSIPEAPANPSLAAGSRRGSAAALYYAGQKVVLIIADMPSAVRVVASVNLSFHEESPSHLAVSDDGALLVYVLPGPDRDAIYAWTAETGSRLLTTAASVSAVTLAPNGDAIVADSEANEVFAIVDTRNAAARHFLADAESGVSTPAGLAVADNGRIYIGNAKTDTVLILDSSGVVATTQPCGCELSGLYPLGPAVYRLSARSGETVYLLEAAQSRDRVVFVPMFRASE